MSDETPARDADLRVHLLVLRCQTGDERAFAQLLETFGPRTLAHLRGLLGDDADDVQQEVWLTVYRSLRTLANPRAFRTWLFRTTRHRAIDFLRARRRDRELVEEAATSIDDSVQPEEPFTNLDDTDAAAALATLPPAHREVLVLRYQEDLSYSDIASVVGCSIGTVRSRLHHAKRQLKEKLT
jgi:RNA polymerase sigma-70 factor (ECF subfamily)